jgi:SAM-dependent methyltransferase
MWPDHFEAPWSGVAQLEIFEEFRQRDNMEIPASQDREGYNSDDDYKYWMAGLSDYFVMRRNVTSLTGKDLVVLDFGGSTGRVSRHFLTERPGTHVTVAEVNVNYVSWINTYGGSRFKAVKTGSDCTIPVGENEFDFAFGISVFTHINDGELEWLNELSRVVKPEGLIYLTILSDHSWKLIDPETLHQIIKGENNPSLAAAIGHDLPANRCAVQLEYEGDSNNWNTFHSTRFIKRKWARVASVERIIHSAHGYQSAVILRNDKHTSKFLKALKTFLPQLGKTSTT